MKKILFVVLLFTSLKVIAQDPAYPATQTAPLNVTKAEYFIDADPGFGNAINIPVTAALDINGLFQSLNISALSPGTHKLGVRSLNIEGEWSITNVINFGIDPNYTTAIPAQLNVVKTEYFIDADPGFGNGINIPVTAALDINGLIHSINISALSPGTHKLGVRSLNAEGEWSITNVITFGIDPNYPTTPATALNVIKTEYFIDADPGFGNAENISLTAAANIPNLISSINTNLLSPGVHRIFVRSLNSEGEWSITTVNQFVVDENPAYPIAPASPGNITFAEYFIDTDPGFGNGTPISISPAVDISNLSVPVNTSSLSSGIHNLFIRAFDDWGLTIVKTFSIDALLPLNFVSFTGKQVSGNVLLTWQTANEINTSHFIIERSVDGQNFTAIGNITANNNTGNNNYQFNDDKLQNNIYYYRLKMVDIDGTYTFSPIIKLIVQQAIKITVYPNPSKDIISINGLQANGKIEVFNMQGQILFQSNVQANSITLEISKYLSGVYVLKYVNENGLQFVSFLKN